jgi:hypothetical protein
MPLSNPDHTYVAMSKQPEIQAHMKQEAALAISFDPADYDLHDVVLAA